MEPDDAALVLACRRNDPAAWEALVTRYQRLIYTIVRRAGLSEDLAAEVFQHVFATLVEQFDRLEQPDRVGAWLATTARREAWRVRRRQREDVARASADRGPHDGSTEAADAVDELADETLLPEKVLLRLEEQHTVRTAVAALDERCRRLLTLLYYHPDPPPYAEIAAALGTREGSIGPTRARCLQKVRRILGDMGF